MVSYIRSDLEFILEQIKIAERNTAGEDLRDILPNVQVPWGLRTLTGIDNNLVQSQAEFGAADNLFPRLLDPKFLPGYDASGMVMDAAPRTISNLIVDQTANNPAAYAAAYDLGADGLPGGTGADADTLRDGVSIVTSPGLNGIFGDGDDKQVFQFNNVTADEGLSAPFNSWMTFFGQFFDHGLDLVTKSEVKTEIVFIKLQPDDPLFNPAPGAPNFMVLTRAAQTINPETGLAESTNTTSPFVDQNQTYSSHESHQVFLREYVMRPTQIMVGDPPEPQTVMRPHATGELLTNRQLVDVDGNPIPFADAPEIGGMATWAVVKAQAREMFGINLTDADVTNVPAMVADHYGNFERGPNGYPLIAMADGTFVEGDPTANGGLGIDISNALRIGHAFLNDIAHSANPVGIADTDDVIGISNPNEFPNPDYDPLAPPGSPNSRQFLPQYDNELLDAHYIAGDGRVNENIGLTAVHAVFHAEHNRLVEHTKATVLADAQALLDGGATQEVAVAFLNEWLSVDVATVPAGAEIANLAWDGQRLFQAAKFGTEMQYQHLVFEEFARTIQPNIDGFLAPNGYDTTIDPSIVAEFAHVVYRFGHSMLTETVDRLDPNFNTIGGDPQMGLIAAFLNPLAFVPEGLTPDQAVGAIVRGVTRQVGNEIDEFVTEALRNNLVGLPLDLAALNLARGRDTGIPSLNDARRQMYEATGDAQLKPYISWVDLMDHLKHPESLINFIAAYGTHSELLAADVNTMAEKRAVAMALVLGGSAEIVVDPLTGETRTFIAGDADRLDFLHSEGAYANNSTTGATITGVDNIDFWVGGLAEEKMPFGGMLGSTFNFVFETQLESLQNGDRFYYLSRTAGMHFGTQLEENSFAKLVMLNSDATHLPAAIFSTPTWVLEVDQTHQYNAGVDGLDKSVDPTGGILLTDLVIRDNPDTIGTDTNYLQYTGEDHVVLGGTANDDIMIAGDGDDTIYGDGGNDRLEGGYGNDTILGGAGDDIIQDAQGDNKIDGGDGNDVISVGAMSTAAVGNLIFGGAGKDFIITTEDISTTFGGKGDDFILGAKTNLPATGNEGNDWIEYGTQDGAPGDNFAPLLADNVIGHDIFIGGGGFDEMIGEGGDDIFVGSDAQDKMDGMSGFDWITYKNDTQGVTADLRLAVLAQPHGNATGDNVGVAGAVGASAASILDRFAEVEGLSGSRFADILYGDDVDAVTLLNHGGAAGGALTNVALIDNLDQLLEPGATGFATGNIILGGAGSDVIQGNGGDDLIDGDKWLNVRISVRENVDGTGNELFSVDSMVDLIPMMLSGQINPGQLVAVREILDSDNGYDTAVFRGNFADYQIVDAGNGAWIVSDSIATRDGTDTLKNVERLQFADGTFVIPGNEALNAEPTGAPTIVEFSDGTGVLDGVVEVGDWLSASSVGLTDLDNISSGGAVVGPISYAWQADLGAGFEDIITVDAGDGFISANGQRLRVTADLEGFAIRLKAVYADENGVTETVFSDPTAPVAPGVIPLAPPPVSPTVPETEGGVGIKLVRSDLDFILDQIRIAEAHARGEDLYSLLPNQRMPLGLRTVDGTFNNLSHPEFGAADNPFPRATDPHFQPGQFGTNYGSNASVMDSTPRTISNLLVDQTDKNPAAYAAAYDLGADGVRGGTGVNADTLKEGVSIVKSPGLDGDFGTADDVDVFMFENVTPDAGLSAPFNSWMTFFGQFFDHGLDLVTKNKDQVIFIPLAQDDPLWKPGGNNFMIVSRTTQVAGPGADGIMGTSDDTSHEAFNTTSPFVDQNQTYSSHPSHQAFLREYVIVDGKPVPTGDLLTNRDLFDENTGTPIAFVDAVETGGMATWGVLKAQAKELFGIILTDADVGSIPMLLTDPYGNLILTDAGNVQVATGDPLNPTFVEMFRDAPAELPANTIRTGHGFLDDIAHNANPAGKTADTDDVVGLSEPGAYDNELLDAHYVAGDGRVNENIGLTAVHAIFHSEHNRLAEQVKQTALNSNDVNFLNEWLLEGHKIAAGDPFPTPDQFDSLVWDGSRIFQAAKFGTEMQYQHLVFEEFARTIQPNVDLFFAPTQVYDVNLDASIVAEFAHTVYRFGHSMLTETVDRFDANFNPVGFGDDPQIGLIAAFLNPLEFAASGATPEEAVGAIVRGVTRQAGNEIDEFVTEALRNNLVGLPLDLAAINIARGRDTGIATLNEVRRQIYDQTGDSNLKPYRSWTDLVQHLKHPESLLNFIAAYGTHVAITSATTLAAKRDAAFTLVMGDGDDSDGVVINGNVYTDRLDFLNSTGAFALATNGATTSGVDNIDLWIGGLAEEKAPFGGMLGSTFNFIFENQLEKLQDGDRFYYLERTAGLAFNAELESNSFAKLIMANSNATHLPALVFSTPKYTLEVDQTKQFNGALGSADPTNDDPLLPLVDRTNPDPDGTTNYLHYRGDDHVVLGGTEGDDILIASIGDDTLWGDGGNDRLEGGYGNDNIRGGAGDDILTDIGGDDNIQGGDGNDVIHGGNGVNLLIGGFGNDFIVTGEDSSEAIGGQGNDFILGTKADEQNMGNEGDDWIEGGTSDGAPGDNFDPLGLDRVIGNDIFIGAGENDKFNAEGGDDIMVGSVGMGDRYIGGSGYDWASFKNDKFGVHLDISDRFFDQPRVPGSGASVLARFDFVEGFSGSAHSDVLRGDNVDAGGLRAAGAQGSVLTNIALINGLQSLLDTAFGSPQTLFDGGNIILGGAGSDIIEGRGGDDIIDGDKWLNVRISVRDPFDSTIEIKSVNSLRDLVPEMLSGAINPGQLVAVREILQSATPDFDTAQFTGILDEYSFLLNGNTITIEELTTPGFVAPDDVLTVIDNSVAPRDGTDRLLNIERLQFADQSITLNGANAGPEGDLSFSGDPVEGSAITVSIAGVTDADNVSLSNPSGAVTGTVAYFWQSDNGTGVFTDILQFAAGEVGRVGGPTFTPTPDLVGQALRVRAVYKDANGVLEEVYSNPTAPVGNVNFDPVGTVNIIGQPPVEDQFLTAIRAFTDADGLTTAVFSYQWQMSPDGTNDWVDIPSGILPTFLPGDSEVGQFLHVVVTYTDDQGTTQTVTSAATTLAVENVNDLPFPADGAAFFDGAPSEGSALTVIPSFFDEDGVPGTLAFEWQVSEDGGITWGPISGAPNSATFTPDASLVGKLLRVQISYTDLHGTPEVVFSEISVPVLDANEAPVGTVDIGDLSPTETLALNATINFTDADGLVGVTFDYQWEQFDGIAWNAIASATASSFTPTQDQVNSQLRVTVSYLDNNGHSNSITSAPTIVTGDFIDDGAAGAALTGTEGQDIIFGNGGADVLTGLGEDDLLDGGAGGDILDGGAGNDTLTGGAADDIVNGDVGDDTIVYNVGDGADTTDGGADADTMNLLGAAAADTLNVVFDGASIVNVGGGTVANVETVNVNLGGGVNTLSYDPPGGLLTTANVVVNLTTGTASGITSLLNVQNVTTGSGSDQLTGDAQANTLNGGAGTDTFFAAIGDGNDNLIGGAGVDTYDLSATTAAATITLGSATSAEIGTDVLSGIENYIGSQGGDTITVNGGVNVIDGQGGADIINAGGGADTVFGGAGDDTIRYVTGDGADTVDGGADNDTLAITGTAAANTLAVVFNGAALINVAGGAISNIENVTADLLGGTDTLSYGASTAAVNVDLQLGTASGFTSIAGIENVVGGSGNDVLAGRAGANTLSGGAGDDRFVARAGDGNDTYNGDGGSDTLDLSLTNANANVTAGAASSAQIGNDTLNGIENLIGSQGNDTINFAAGVNVIDGQGGNDTINSGAGNDVVLGGSGNDTINAGAGADRITGGTGNDTMTGGGGVDTFVFGTNFGLDRIIDFDSVGGNADRLNLDSSLGINAGNFGAHVAITTTGGGTLVTIDGVNTITLLGVAAATVTIDDFTFGP
ncbi:MAG: heme peroxidase [Alphaproteobacteria bacterium]|nr:heme peroxidase [Alphaproteobacteria bacterium]